MLCIFLRTCLQDQVNYVGRYGISPSFAYDNFCLCLLSLNIYPIFSNISLLLRWSFLRTQFQILDYKMEISQNSKRRLEQKMHCQMDSPLRDPGNRGSHASLVHFFWSTLCTQNLFTLGNVGNICFIIGWN